MDWKKILIYVAVAIVFFVIGWWSGAGVARYDVAAEINRLERAANSYAESTRRIKEENRELESRIDRSIELTRSVEQSIDSAGDSIGSAIRIVDELIEYLERNRIILSGY